MILPIARKNVGKNKQETSMEDQPRNLLDAWPSIRLDAICVSLHLVGSPLMMFLISGVSIPVVCLRVHNCRVVLRGVSWLDLTQIPWIFFKPEVQI